MTETNYTNRYCIIGNDIDGLWVGPENHVFDRNDLIAFLENEFKGFFNQSRGEFDVAIYRVPEGGIKIMKKYGYYLYAASKHQVLEASYMTADKLTSQTSSESAAGTEFTWGCGLRLPPLKCTIPK